jgi:signal transduction histidine kinase
MADRLDRRERRRLRWRLALFYIALAIPTVLLLWKALDQLEWEAMHQSRLAAEELTRRIDDRLGALIAEQNARSFADFAFLTVAGDPAAGFVQRSPLSAFPVGSDLPGVIGWFQIDAAGRLSTPILPAPTVDAAAYGIGPEELAGRQALAQRISAILDQNALVAQAATDEPPAARDEETAPAFASFAGADSGRRMASREKTQAIFEQLAIAEDDKGAAPSREAAPEPAEALRADALGRTAPSGTQPEETRASRLAAAMAERDTKAQEAPERQLRKERTALPEPFASASGISPSAPSSDAPTPPQQASATPTGPRAHRGETARARPDQRIRIFESELDLFRVGHLDSGHLVLFRWAWREGARYVQGALIDRPAFLSEGIGEAFRAAALGQTADLTVLIGNAPAAHFGAAGDRYVPAAASSVPKGTMLFRARLQEPFGALQLVFRAEHVPSPPGAALVYWLGGILAIVLSGGVWLLYRLGLRQLGLIRQQQDFVAAVSHELKTPLTSIRMYSEMLREGWVTDAKRSSYYRFIHDESERLSRLVANVLQLARLSRDKLQVVPQPVRIAELLEDARPTLLSQTSHAGFALTIDCPGNGIVCADRDAVTQILINLVDNAVKFAAGSEPRRIEIGCTAARSRHALAVRDYGPGIPTAERKRALRLFQRLECEATRETRGTGIGLALVKRLAEAMGGELELLGREPGLEVRVWLPTARPDGR